MTSFYYYDYYYVLRIFPLGYLLIYYHYVLLLCPLLLPKIPSSYHKDIFASFARIFLKVEIFTS